MAKTKIIAQRMSGRPVLPEQYEAYDKEFKEGFDKIQAECGLDMLKMHEKLIALDQELAPKYQSKEILEMPKSQKAWHELISRFDTPVLVAKSSEDPKVLVLVLMDQPLG